MNKDLDERIVPNGEYRDALNVQVSTSDEANVGAVQNILGNTLINTRPKDVGGFDLNQVILNFHLDIIQD